MPEANILFTVAAVVAAALVVWVLAVLKTAKEPWARPAAAAAIAAASSTRAPDVPVEKTEEPKDEAEKEEPPSSDEKKEEA